MEKRELTHQEMVDLFYKYYDRGAILFLLSLLLTGTSTVFIAGLNLNIVGWSIIALSICPIVSGTICMVRSYRYKKAFEKPLQSKWLKETNEKWERTYQQQK